MSDPIDDPSPEVRCPICRRPWPGVTRPRVSLDDNVFIADRGVVQLTGTEAELMWVLVTRMPGAVALDSLYSALWGGTEPAQPENDLRVHVSHLREKIAPLGFVVENIHGRAYRLLPSLEAA